MEAVRTIADRKGTDECICTGKDSRYNRGLEITFMGCVLNFVLDHGLDGLEEEIRQMLGFPVQQHPSLQHVMELLKSCRIRKKYKNT